MRVINKSTYVFYTEMTGWNKETEDWLLEYSETEKVLNIKFCNSLQKFGCETSVTTFYVRGISGNID